jgi:hypothetical protein
VRLTYDETRNTLHKTVFCGTPPATNGLQAFRLLKRPSN